jgi:hypothetical protein
MVRYMSHNVLYVCSYTAKCTIIPSLPFIASESCLFQQSVIGHMYIGTHYLYVCTYCTCMLELLIGM